MRAGQLQCERRNLPTRQDWNSACCDALASARRLRCQLGDKPPVPQSFQKSWSDPDAAPAFQGGLADAPAFGQLLLVEVNDFHLGLLPNELAGVHEGAVPPESQVIRRRRLFAAEIAEIGEQIRRTQNAACRHHCAAAALASDSCSRCDSFCASARSRSQSSGGCPLSSILRNTR